MNDELFTELVQSVHEGGAILRGEQEPTRRFEIAAPDVKQIRERSHGLISHLRPVFNRANEPFYIGNRFLESK